MIFKRLTAMTAMLFVALALVPAEAGASGHSGSASVSTSLVGAGLNPAVLDEALEDYAAHQDRLANPRYIGIIDYTIHASQPRFFVHDLEQGSTEVFLVAHGAGSDPRHEGRPTVFSNMSGSKMTSVGAYVTAETYYGKHGLSLKLDGLAATNSAARERFIVIHGADYVNADRGVIGRSWGCPAVARNVAGPLIEKFKGGAFLYIHGAPDDDEQPNRA